MSEYTIEYMGGEAYRLSCQPNQIDSCGTYRCSLARVALCYKPPPNWTYFPEKDTLSIRLSPGDDPNQLVNRAQKYLTQLLDELVRLQLLLKVLEESGGA